MKNDINQSILNSLGSTHKSFSYLADGIESTGLNEFVELTIDISAGIQTCLDLVSSSNIARECGEMPLIGLSDSSNLLRLSMAASKLLRDDALRAAEWLSEHKSVKGGKS